jgi:tetratricopeptide (TPR) repeat protein
MTGEEISTLAGHQYPVYDVKISHDGRRIASAAAAPENHTFDQQPTPRLGEVIVWDPKSGQPIRTMQSDEGPAFCLAFSPTENCLAVGGADGTARIWSIDTGDLRAECTGHTAAVQGVGFSADGRRLATGSDDSSVRVWDVQTGQSLLVLRGHGKGVASVDFAREGHRLISSTKFSFVPGEVVIWEPRSLERHAWDSQARLRWHERSIDQARTANDSFGAVHHALALLDAGIVDSRLASKCADAMFALKQYALAEELYRAAIAKSPLDAELQHRLGHTFVLRGDLAGAAQVYRDLTKAVPSFADGFYSLGNTLRDLGDLERAQEAFENAVRVKPEYAEAHCNLGRVLERRGLFAEALQELKRGHELGSQSPRWQYPSAQWIAEAERFLKAEELWEDLKRNEDKQVDDPQRLELAQMTFLKGYKLAAAQFYKEVVDDQPDGALDPASGTRYNAACAAVLAGIGHGEDAGSLTAESRTDWRSQALRWLNADLDAWQSALETAPQKRTMIASVLTHWRRDPDLAGVRDAALDGMSDDERDKWTAFWTRAEDLLARCTSSDNIAP